MKRKESTLLKDETSFTEPDEVKPVATTAEAEKPPEDQEVFLMEDGKLRPFSPEDYTTSTLYQVVESFSVECKLVRPEDPGNLIFEGKRPSKKTLPIIVTRQGESILLESWESLESKPEQLADVAEVIGVTPVKQIFVLKRK